jgi:hypothetical protein
MTFQPPARTFLNQPRRRLGDCFARTQLMAPPRSSFEETQLVADRKH